MATTWPGQPPSIIVPPNKPAPEIRAFPVAANPTFFYSGLVTLTGGAVQDAGSNPAANTILGLALHDPGAIYQNPAGQPVLSSLFGTGQNLQTPLWNSDTNLALVCLAHNGQLFEFSYNQPLPPSGSIYAVIGTQVGFTKTGGIYYADSTATNKTGVILDVATYPQNIIGVGATTFYNNSDVNARVIVQITSTII